MRFEIRFRTTVELNRSQLEYMSTSSRSSICYFAKFQACNGESYSAIKFELSRCSKVSHLP